MDPWSFESIWGFLEAAFLVFSFMWIASLLFLAAVVVATVVEGRRSKWVSKADLLDHPEPREPAEGSRFAAA